MNVHVDCVLQLRPHLTSVLLDQLPVLCDLQRYLEHLAVMDTPAVKSELILEQVCHHCRFSVVVPLSHDELVKVS